MVTACTAIATSANPDNSGGVALTTKPETNDGLSTAPTANWTVNSTNARLTITNNDTGAAVDAAVFLEIYVAKNV